MPAKRQPARRCAALGRVACRGAPRAVKGGMKIVMADADLTEFDWVGFVGAWVLVWGLLWLTQSVLVVQLSLAALHAWRK
jgi:hypothetical protein